MVLEKEWPLPMVEKYWPAEELRAEKS